MNINPIQEARNHYRSWTSDLFREAVTSTLTHLALGLATVGCGTLLGQSLAVERVRPPLVSFLLFSSIGFGAATWVKGLDTEADWEAWRELNKGDRRADFLSKLATAQADSLTQVSTYWFDYHRSQHLANLKGFDHQPQMIPHPTIPTSAIGGATQDIAQDLATNLKSTIIVGQPGSGKGLTVAHATRRIKQIHPDITIWAIDPKADPEERVYWDACDCVLGTPLPPFASEMEVERFQNEADTFIKQFRSLTGRKLLIFDEALAVKELAPKWFKGCMAGFNHLCSTGRSKGIYGWLLSQTPNATDFGISGGARNVYRRVLLASVDDLGLIYNRSTFFTGVPNESLFDVTGRIFFDSLGNRWGAVPHYPIFEGSPMGNLQSRHEQLERMFESPTVESPHEPVTEVEEERLDPRQQSILDFCQRKGGGATVREIQRSGLAQLKGLDSAAIRELCDRLIDLTLAQWEDTKLVVK